MWDKFDNGTYLTLGQGLVISGWDRVIQLIPSNGKTFDMREWTTCDDLELRIDGQNHHLSRGEVEALREALNQIVEVYSGSGR